MKFPSEVPLDGSFSFTTHSLMKDSSPNPQCPHLPAQPISWAYKIRLNYWLPFTNSISVVKLRIPPHLNSGALILMSQSITKIVPEGEQMTFSYFEFIVNITSESKNRNVLSFQFVPLRVCTFF